MRATDRALCRMSGNLVSASGSLVRQGRASATASALNRVARTGCLRRRFAYKEVDSLMLAFIVPRLP